MKNDSEPRSIFDFTSYRPYVVAALGGANKRSGLRSKAALAIGCALPYLSQILRGDADFSVEQAFALAGFLGLDPDERRMLLLLVQKERAGRADLRRHYESEIQALLEKRQSIKNRLHAEKDLGPDDAAVYYGSWLYAALHMLVAIPEFRAREAIAERLKLEPAALDAALAFLESRGLLARRADGRYQVGPRHLHLAESSPNIRKHHSNWRLKALQSLDRPAGPSEIHYSAAVTLSHRDAADLKERFLSLVQSNMKTIGDSPEETLYCTVIDWFEVR